MESQDVTGLYDSFGSVAGNGYHVTAAIGGLGADNAYTVDIATAYPYPNYFFSESLYDYYTGGTNIAIGTAVMANFTALYSGLVFNGGFQLSGFSGWTLSGDTSNTFVDDGAYSGMPVYFGSNEAALGTSGSLGYLSQTLSTTAGETYLLSFWFANPDGDPGEFLVSWNGEMIVDAAEPSATTCLNSRSKLYTTVF